MLEDDEKIIQNSGWKPERIDYLADLGVDGRKILKWMLRKRGGECGLGLSCSC
jgi:hypothetical protein